MADRPVIFALDLETTALFEHMADYAALQPFRTYSKEARIDSCAVYGNYGDMQEQILWNTEDQFVHDFKKILEKLQGCIVVCHNAVFDVAWSIALLSDGQEVGPAHDLIRGIVWIDSMLLAKWVSNGQTGLAAYTESNEDDADEDPDTGSLSLINLCLVFLKGHEKLAEFHAIKSQPFSPHKNREYWTERGLIDVVMTHDLTVRLLDILPPIQVNGFMVEQANIVPNANAWRMGIEFDKTKLAKIEDEATHKQATILEYLQVPGSQLTSPKQLAYLLYNQMQFQPQLFTPSGGPSTSKDALLYLHFSLVNSGNVEAAKVIRNILDYKKLATMKSKYTKGFVESEAHNGVNVIYSAPRIFGTYTGRYTYASKTKKKYRTSIATHQLPRKGPIKTALVPPEGYVIAEFDAAAQESRLMAIRSKDPTMLQIFRDGLNFHSVTGARLANLQYSDFQTRYEDYDEHGTAENAWINENRQAGKLINLSCNYRIGDKALQDKAFTGYDIVLTLDMAKMYNQTFKTLFPGVPMYWDDSIKFAKNNGYAYSFDQRRYYISQWGGRDAWKSESSAINLPIQGGGAAMKTLAVKEMSDQYPEALFCLDMHDASFFFVKQADVDRGIILAMRDSLNNLPYKKYWEPSEQPDIDLLWDAMIGPSFGEVRGVK